jgi:cobalt-precorrin-5B (C1)-methyltransferase
MRQERPRRPARPRGPLRRGWTTGTCATAASAAAYTALVTGDFPDPVTVRLPGGASAAFALTRYALTRYALADASASAAVTKDAGDDPDVTHGAVVWARVRPAAAGTGVRFAAGSGVGTVTRPGLVTPVGEPAINPVPRRMMIQTLTELAVALGGYRDVVVEVGVDGGQQLAERTWNPRLGIVGGLSVLGTTGVVVPFSCSAWIDGIRQAVDIARAAGHEHLAACTGSTSQAAVRAEFGLADTAVLDMAEFAGAVLTYLRRHPVSRLTVAGGFAKLTKLASGHLDLHSARSQVDLEWLADVAVSGGAGPGIAGRIRGANTALEVLRTCQVAGLPLADLVAEQARQAAVRVLAGARVEVDVLVVGRSGEIVGRAAPVPAAPHARLPFGGGR